MVWSFEFYNETARKSFDDLPFPAKQFISKAIRTRLIVAPNDYGKSLSGNLHGHRRLRCGHYRIIYKVDEQRSVVTIVALGLRRDVYD